MVLDVNIIRQNTELVRKSQQNRFRNSNLLDKVIVLDNDWRKQRFNCDKLNQLKNLCSKVIGKKMKDKECLMGSGDNIEPVAANSDLTEADLLVMSVDKIKTVSKDLDGEITTCRQLVAALEHERNKLMSEIGNILHKDVIVSNNEDDNGLIRLFGDTTSRKKFSHVDLVETVGGVNFNIATKNSGGRCYFLKGALAFLEDALVSFASWTLLSRNYERVNPPLWLNKDAMQEVSQLAQFDSELYKVTCKRSEDPTIDDGEDERYLIATSEQAIAASYRDTWVSKTDLPLRQMGVSECFRQEVGSHGRDTRGIFRVHQFRKVEQFCVTSPHDGESERMFAEMMENAEYFYQQLVIPYRVVSIVSGELNNAASIKYDLEGWFPGSGCFRELVSCSNCTDYQARSVLARFGETKLMNQDVEYVHMLNCTMCATTRVLCAILENYQGDGGVVVPSVLKPFMPEKYRNLIPFVVNQ